MLLGAALLNRGFSVFGSPLSTRAESEVLDTSPSWLDWTSNDPFTKPSLMTLPDTNSRIGVSPVSVLPEASYEVSPQVRDPARVGVPIQIGVPAQLELGDSIGSSFEIASSPQKYRAPADLEAKLTLLLGNMLKYCTYELSPDKSSLKLKVSAKDYPEVSEETDWVNFLHEFYRDKPGFALYRVETGQLLSIMNVRNDRCQNLDNTALCTDFVTILKKFKAQWEPLVKYYFPAVQIYDEVRLDIDLAGIRMRSYNGISGGKP